MRKMPNIIIDAKKITHEEWLETRKQGIGGSDASKILNVNPWATPLDLYIDKTSPVISEKSENWFRLDYGNLIEPLIRKWYASESGYKVYNDTKMYSHPDYPWMIADCDFIAETPEGEIIGGEIKSTSPRNIEDDWAPGILGMGGKLPYHYEVQVRHYMAVRDIDRFIVLCIYGNCESQIIPVQVYRDMEWEACLIEAEAQFWNEHVVPRIPPAGGITPASLETVRAEVFADGKKEEELVLSDDAKDILSHFLSLKETEKTEKAKLDSIKKELDAATAEILRVTEGHTVAKLDLNDDEYYFIKNNTVSKKIPDSGKLKLNYPDVWEDVQKEVSYDTTSVRIKAKKGAKA